MKVFTLLGLSKINLFYIKILLNLLVYEIKLTILQKKYPVCYAILRYIFRSGISYINFEIFHTDLVCKKFCSINMVFCQ